MRALNHHKLKPNLDALECGGELGKEMIPNAFPLKDEAPAVDPEGVGVADPVCNEAAPDFPEANPTRPIVRGEIRLV